MSTHDENMNLFFQKISDLGQKRFRHEMSHDDFYKETTRIAVNFKAKLMNFTEEATEKFKGFLGNFVEHLFDNANNSAVLQESIIISQATLISSELFGPAYFYAPSMSYITNILKVLEWAKDDESYNKLAKDASVAAVKLRKIAETDGLSEIVNWVDNITGEKAEKEIKN